MVAPVRQTCPECGKDYLGSDCLGQPCVDCMARQLNKQSDEINHLLHGLWTKAVGTPDYDKSQWRRLVQLLNAHGIPV